VSATAIGGPGLLGAWRAMLDELVPARWRAIRLPRRALIVSSVGSSFRVAQIGGGKVIERGRIAPGTPSAVIEPLRRLRLPVVLRLGDEDALHVDDTLPRAAERDLGSILQNRIESLGPWPQAETCFDHRIVARPAPGELTVRVTLAHRDRVDKLSRQLAELGLPVDHVDVVETDPMAPPRIDLLRCGEIRAGTLPWVRLAALVLVASVAIGGWLAGLIWQQAGRVAEAQARQATLREEAAAIAPLRRQLELAEARAAALRSRVESSPSALDTLEALSEVLPDTAWLEDLRLAGDQLQISGYGDDAAALLPTLEESPAIDRAEFRAASTRATVTLPDGQTREVDRFTIASRVIRTELPR
jgi:general secretion pathway protein L